MDCPICCDSIKDELIVKYEINNEIQIYNFCSLCTTYILDNHFKKYITDISKADCFKSLTNSLKYPIPDKLTYNTLNSGVKIDRLLINKKFISSKLQKSISDEDLITLNKDLKNVYENLNQDNYDYMKEINIILKKYSLNNI